MEEPLGRPRAIATATTSIPAKNLTTPRRAAATFATSAGPGRPARRATSRDISMSALGHTTPRWGLRQPRQKAVSCWHHGSLVEVGYRCASVSFDPCATPFFLEVIPLAPPVAARTPAIALTGFLSGLALRGLFAVPGDVFVGQARGIETQPLGQLSAEPLVLLAASHYASSSSVRCARCRPFTERRSCPAPIDAGRSPPGGRARRSTTTW